MIRQTIAKFIKPKNSQYHPVVKVGFSEVQTATTFIKAVYIVSQPNSYHDLALRIDYELPKYCLKHRVQFKLISGDTELISNSLSVGEIRSGKMHYLMNSIHRSIAPQVKLLFHLSDEKYPTANIYTFELQVGEFPIT
ncbi:hypothetical protein KO489_07940 [Reinekea forsetii]|nr:hypothetical protein [Reinekea forsetii]